MSNTTLTADLVLKEAKRILKQFNKDILKGLEIMEDKK